jgi:hypothetical protein
MAHGGRQAQLLRQGPYQRGNRAPLDIEEGANQDTGPLTGSPLAVRIEVGGEDVAVALEVLGAPGDMLEAMKPVDRRNAMGVGLLGIGRVGNPKQSLRQPLRVESGQGEGKVRH